jgi:hypothetical protein
MLRFQANRNPKLQPTSDFKWTLLYMIDNFFQFLYKNAKSKKYLENFENFRKKNLIEIRKFLRI